MHTILLAAGLSTRMGRQKLLLPFDGGTVIEAVIDNLRSAGLTPLHAVLSQEVADTLTPNHDRLDIAVNPAPERGQSSSLAIGLDMLPDGADFCIMLGDLPLAKADDILNLIAKFNSMPPDKTVMAPCRDGVFGHPMFYRSIWKKRFKSACGDSGGRKILLEHEAEILRTTASDGHFCDMDTPADYDRIINKM